MQIINNIVTNENTIALDEGFYFGYGAFETLLVLKRPVLLEEHLARLNQSVMQLGIHKEICAEEVDQAIKQLNCKNEALKINVSKENVIYSKRPIHYTDRQYKRGFNLRTSQVRKNPTAHSSYIKSMNYLDIIIENKRAKSLGYDDCLFLNTDNMVAETCFSNIFWLKDHQIYTPSIKSGLLPGIVREWILNNYHVIEGTYDRDHLFDSDGVFITNSLMGIMQVCKIDQYEIPRDHSIECINQEYKEFLKKYQ